jgi:hypothetical protein
MRRMVRFLFGVTQIKDWRSGKAVVILLIANALLTAQTIYQSNLIAAQREVIAYLMRHVCFGK